jgi:hypothetical protein
MHNEVKKNALLFEAQLTKMDGIDVNVNGVATPTANGNGGSAGAGAAGAVDGQPRAVRKETIQVVQQWLAYLDRFDSHLTALESFVEFLHTPHPTSVASNVIGAAAAPPPPAGHGPVPGFAPATNGFARR